MNQLSTPGDKNYEYSIGVVTYVARFEEFLIPLIRQLTEVFPDKEIICILNGHPDKTLQIEYLKNITAFLSQFPNVRYLSYENHQPLAKCFNWLMMMSFAPRMLLLNDDISLNFLFRQDFEKALLENNHFFIINQSWSHCLISKELIKQVGWFEERLLGSGHEDTDFQIRMERKGLPLVYKSCRGIINIVAPQKNAGWKEISEGTGTEKTANVNTDFFNKKYAVEHDSKGNVTKITLRPGMEHLVFYDLVILGDNPAYPEPSFHFKTAKPKFYLRLLVPVYFIYSSARKIGGKLYRALKRRP